jgi:hypothetical protein
VLAVARLGFPAVEGWSERVHRGAIEQGMGARAVGVERGVVLEHVRVDEDTE